MSTHAHSLRGPLRRTKVAFSVLVIALVGGIVLGARWSAQHHVLGAVFGMPDAGVSAQHDVAAARLPAASLARYRAFAATPVADRGPLVLSYHDVRAHPNGPYAITPARFDEQMAMLQAAGFHTISVDQLLAYGVGKPLPPRSVLLTFDDGTGGLWQYADKILERRHMRGVSFVISGDVSDVGGGYYLSWSELQRMQRSGRWDLESHSHDGHGLVKTNAQGATGAFFVNREWIPRLGRLETLDEFRRRITGDLDTVAADFRAHDLRLPKVFAHPRSATVKDSNDPATVAVLADVLKQRYADSFTNEDFASQLDADQFASGTLPRLEILGSMTADDVFDTLVRAVAMPVTDVHAFSRPELWVNDAGKPIAGIAGNRLTLTNGDKTWAAAHLAPGATSGWSRYGVSVSVDGLGAKGSDVSAGLTVLDGSPHQYTVGVSTGFLTVRQGVGAAAKEIGTAKLAPSTSHVVSVTVDRGALVVAADGHQVFRGPAGAPGAPDALGGPALSVWRSSPGLPVPIFEDVHVTPVGAAP